MNDHGKSYDFVVPTKRPNKAFAAEVVEGRRSAEWNTTGKTRPGLCAGLSVSSALDRVREKAGQDKEVKFTALLHHVTLERLKSAYAAIRPRASAGVDGVTWRAYGENLDENLADLYGRVQRGAYRAKPVLRAFIPKTDGRSRPLGIAALEDKIVQRAVVEVLNAIYETDFLGFSYGFRPGRSQHDALDALFVGITERKVNWVLDADICSFFDSIDHEWMMRFIEHRIADKRVLRLIRKWLGAGVIENGIWSETVEGTPQGASVSTLLANVFLHYVLDLWAHQWRSQYARGDVIIVRYADDFVAGFQFQDDAQRFLEDLHCRLVEFSLELHPEKTRLIEFGRFAAQNREKRGLPKPETFNFLGFTHVCAKAKRGRFKLKRITNKKRLRAKLREVKTECQRRMHLPIPEQGRWLQSVVRGHNAYYAVPDNSEALDVFRDEITQLWFRALRRRSQRTRLTWERMQRLIKRWLLPTRITHPWPDKRFKRQHARQEPSALNVHAGVCAGGYP